MNKISYTVEKDLSPEEFIDVLKRSTLSERRPVNEPGRIADMLRYGNLIITARDKGRLVGVARSLTDFSYCTYLSDLAVDVAYQKKGIGKELIRKTKFATPKATLILLAAPDAANYYPKVGMIKHEDSFVLKNIEDLQ